LGVPTHFCTRCGNLSDERPDARRRVCDDCEMGMLLTCPGDALPGRAAAFLICTYDLTVTAVSESGEQIFGREDELVGRSLLDLVTSPLGDEQVALHAELAAQRESAPVVMPLRLRANGGAKMGMLAGRIATCEPPRGALVAVEPSGLSSVQ
jgi:PAS domain-containing protein